MAISGAMCWLKGVVLKSRMIWNATNKRTNKKLEFRTCLLSEVIFYPPPSPLWPQRNVSYHCRRRRGSPGNKFQCQHLWETMLRSPRFLVKLPCGWHILYLLFRIHATFRKSPMKNQKENTGNTSKLRFVFGRISKYLEISSFFAVFSNHFPPLLMSIPVQ